MPQCSGKNNSTAEYNRFDYTLTPNPREIQGRSLVNFTGNTNKKYEKYDRQFIDMTSKNLRLSDKDREIFNSEVKKFLKNHNLKNLEDIIGENNRKIQGSLIETIGTALNLSDLDFNILSGAVFERMYYEDEYVPLEDKYEKDYEVVDYILDKYDYNEAQKAEIFDVMKMEAENRNFNNIFELFKLENKPERFIYLLTKYCEIDDNTSTDIVLDFINSAAQDAKTRHSQINPWKYSGKENEEAKDYTIACDIIEQYGLSNDEDGNISTQIYRRREGVSVEQIAFELMEEYNLNAEAYKFIKNIIYEYDNCDFDENEEENELFT